MIVNCFGKVCFFVVMARKTHDWEGLRGSFEGHRGSWMAFKGSCEVLPKKVKKTVILQVTDESTDKHTVYGVHTSFTRLEKYA